MRTWAEPSTWPAGCSETVTSRSFSDETLRQTITVTAPGDRVRLRISNIFGSQPLALAEVRVARELEPHVTAPNSDRPVLFAGEAGATIPAAAEALSDAVDLEVSPGDRLIVSIYAWSLEPTAEPAPEAAVPLAH